MSPRSPEGMSFERLQDDDTTEEVPAGARVPHVTEFVSKDTLRVKTEAFFAGLAGIGERVLETEREGGASIVYNILNGWDHDVRSEVAKLPEVPFETLVRDRAFMQSTVDAIAKGLPEDHRSIASLLASLILNRTMEAVSPELRAGVRQDVNGDGLHFLGYAWNGGELTIRGEAGNGVGLRMTGGEIDAWVVGKSAGEMMTGGLLSVQYAKDSLGARMYGGTIDANTAGNYVGDQMQGGTIRVREAGEYLGQEMGDGLIEADRATQYVGALMAGGTIRIGRAGGVLGNKMKGGTIEVQDCLTAGFGMSGGTIVAKNVQIEAGYKMSDGLITIDKYVGMIGSDITGGEIRLAGTAEVHSPERLGGTVKFVGPGSMIRNLVTKIFG